MKGVASMRKTVFAALIGATLISTGASFAQEKAGLPKEADRLAIALDSAKQLLLFIETNKDGKISKQQWMDFMSAEFDRLDREHRGEIDPRRLLESKEQTWPRRSSDQGK
jgi:hypothetical protein